MDKESKVAGMPSQPLYARVTSALKDEIISGTFPVGAQLPTEDELSARFSVSRSTVREAMRRLREQGLVASRQGVGTVVVPPPDNDSYVLHSASIDDLLTFAQGANFDLDSFQVVKIDDKLSIRTGLPSGDDWLMVKGLRKTEGSDEPMGFLEYYINREYASVSRLLKRHKGPLFPLIEDLFAVRITEVGQEISADTADETTGNLLSVDIGSAIITIRRTYKIEDGSIAQVTINTHPASRFRHSMTMRRVSI